MKQEVYFEIYGKKMKTTVVADTAEEAKAAVIAKIKWHKIKPIGNDAFNTIWDIVNGKR